MATPAPRPPRAPDPLWMSIPRFAMELVAWVAAPWALAPHSVVLAVLAVVVLIGVPTVFGTPGSKTQTVRVAVPGAVGIALECGQAAVAIVASAFAWPPLVTGAVVVLAVVALALQAPRWRWMLTRPATAQ